MDGLSIAASLIAVIQLTGKITSLSYGYITGVKKAPKGLGDLVDELGPLSKVLILLQNYASGDGSSSTALRQLHGPLKRCTDELQTLQSKLELTRLVERLKWPLKEKETLQHIARLERHKTLFAFALTTDQASLSKAIEAHVKETNLAVCNVQKDLNQTRSEIRYLQGTADGMKLAVDNFHVDFQAEAVVNKNLRQQQENLRSAAKRKKVLNWIHSGKFDKIHNVIASRRQKDTGQWLLGHPGVLAWIRGQLRSGSRLLWGYGIPGGGKTFLSSVIIDHLLTLARTENYGVAYIYFDYKEQDQRPSEILASLAKQLLSQSSSLPQEVEHLYNTLEPLEQELSLEDSYAALIATSKLFNRVFLIFDALDECDEGAQRDELLALFSRLGEDGINLLLTSRPYPEDIQDSLRNSTKIELEAHPEDIAIYIERKIEKSTRASRLVRQAKCKDRIISELVASAKGMFLLIHFHIEYLCQQTTAKQLLAALDKLKSSSTGIKPLDPTYDRAMQTIQSKHTSCMKLALDVLSWLVKARRTFTVQELRTAVSIEPGRYGLDDFDLPDQVTLLDVCAGLVTIDEENNTIQLAHYTVQEYLMENCMISTDIEYKIAMACTTFLSFDIFAQGPCTSYYLLKARLKKNPFLNYAAHHVGFHLKACDGNSSAGLVLKFVESPGSVLSYLQARYLHTSSEHGLSNYSTYPRGRRPLHIASALGHHVVAQKLLANGADISAMDRDGETALQIALAEGHEAVACLLLESGTSISFPSRYRQPALHLAASYGHVAVCQLLLTKGADISALDASGRTALHTAAYKGHDAVVKLFLEYGVDLWTLDKNGESALLVAASRGYEAVVRLLLQRGSDSSIRNNYGETALYLATLRGHEAVARLLLEGTAGCSVLSRYGFPNRYGQTVLQEAASRGYDGIIRILLENTTDPDLPISNKDGCTLLHIAASAGHRKVAEIFLEKGVNSTIQNHSGQTALHLACLHGHEAVARLLLQNSNGTDIFTPDKRGRTALHDAASEVHDQVVHLLLHEGADWMAIEEMGYTPLHSAASNGHDTVVQQLLDKGSRPSILNNHGQTVLQVATLEGRRAVVRLLLERCTDPLIPLEDKKEALRTAVTRMDISIVRLLLENEPGCLTPDISHNGCPALHIAASKVDRSTKSILKLLLDQGADISVTHEGLAALHVAADVGNLEATRVLLDYGASTLATTDLKNTALHIAAATGHDEIAQQLLQAGANHSSRNINGLTPLHLAATNGRLLAVSVLLSKGAELSATDKHGATVFLLAASFRHAEIAYYLLKKGADIYTLDNTGSNALHYAARGGNVALVRFLLEKGVDPSPQGIDGKTPLMLGAKHKHSLLVEVLLKGGADISVSCSYGCTALHHAVHSSRQVVARLFLDNGADPSARNIYGDTSLMIASANEDEAMVELLLERGANTSIPSLNGITPLLFAASAGHEAIVQLLINNGAEISAAGYHGMTPLLVAVMECHETIVRLLLEKGADYSVRDESGATALDRARSSGYGALVNLLQNHIDRICTREANNNKKRPLEEYAEGDITVLEVREKKR